MNETTRRLNPRNKERLQDVDIMRILTHMNKAMVTTVIDPLWITNAMTHEVESRRLLFQSKVTEAIRTSKLPVLLMPLYDDEHWSLLVLFSGTMQHRDDGTVPYTSYFLLDSASRHTEYSLTVLSWFALDALVEYRLPKKTPQQTGDWECGHFILMNASMMIDFCQNYAEKPGTLLEILRRHLLSQMMSASYRNIRAFSQDILTQL